MGTSFIITKAVHLHNKLFCFCYIYKKKVTTEIGKKATNWLTKIQGKVK